MLGNGTVWKAEDYLQEFAAFIKSKANEMPALSPILTLTKAFLGEFVPKHSTDEPASTLLERLLSQSDPAAKPKLGLQARPTSA